MEIKVHFRIKTDKLEAYEFETSEEVEGIDYFRLEIHKDGERYILVAYRDELFVSEDMTGYFDVPYIEEQCKKQESVDITEEYLDFLESESA